MSDRLGMPVSTMTYGLAARTARCLVLVTAAAAAGCSSPRSYSAPILPLGVYDFVFSSAIIDHGESQSVAGFNVDGVFTSTGAQEPCQYVDQVSDLDPDLNQGGCMPGGTCVGGIDNVLPEMLDSMDDFGVGTTVPNRAKIATALNGGHLVYLLRLSGVDSLSDDEDIVVSLYEGYSADANCSAMFSGSGQFYVAENSLLESGDLSQPKWQAHGAIINSRFRVRYGLQPGVAQEAPPDFLVNQLALRATLDANGAAAIAGNAGGWVVGSVLLDYLSDLMPVWSGTFHGFIPQRMDLPATDGTCGWIPEAPAGGVAGGASMGARFALVHADIIGSASAPPAGACGAN